MRRAVIIKVGKTFGSLLPGAGDFEHWILAGMGMDRERAHVIHVCEGAPLPDYDAISGVIITGSHEMVTEQLDWSERTATWLPGLVERKIPVLGICYGHQLLAYAMGGKVGDNPLGMHFGTVNIERYRKDLREEGQDPDKLIKESTETSAGPEFLRRFAEIVEARKTSLEFE